MLVRRSLVRALLGETVVQVGAGSGYDTAIVAQMVGPHGKVVAFEVDAALARRARSNLATCANVAVRAASATEAAIPPCDGMYVNAGVTDPPSGLAGRLAHRWSACVSLDG